MTDAALQSTRPRDPNVSQRAASDPGQSVWVGASAGSGKTKVLTDRVLRLMLAGTPPQRILCLTFTKAAAAEMAIRVNRTLGGWATADDAELDRALSDLDGRAPSDALRTRARQLFARVVDCPGGLKIQTIHAFCQSLLRRFPLEAGVAPRFEAMDEVAARALIGESLIEALLSARMQPDSPVGAAVLSLSAVLNPDEFRELTGGMISERGRLARILEHHGGIDGDGLEGTRRALWRTLGLKEGDTPESVLRNGCDEESFDGPGLRMALTALSGGSKSDVDRAAVMAPWLAASVDERAAGYPAYRLAFLTATDGAPRKTLITKKPAEANPAAADALFAEAERLVRLDERHRRALTAHFTDALLTLAEALLERYRHRKEARGSLDFDDLILRTVALLSGRVPWVLYKLDGGLDHILIDEAQDTNPDQWRVVAAIADEFFAGMGAAEQRGVTRTVFAVGDEKQSIFSFQRADPAEFARMRDHFAGRAADAAQPWETVALDISFRSVAAVLETVDAVFANPLGRDGVASSPTHTIRHHPFRRGHGGMVELWPPIAPEDPPEAEAWAPPVSGSRPTPAPATRLATTIAETIRGWLDDGERLESRNRPIRAGDILVLVRTRGRFVFELIKALKDRGVPVAGADRISLGDSLAVRDLMAVADFLLLPEDDLTLATLLKSPFIGLSEEELFTLAWERPGRLWPALVDRAERDPAYAPARRWLGDLLAVADFVPPYELFRGLLSRPCPTDTVSGRRALTARLGSDALDPVDEFLAMALAFERTEPPSLQRFLAWVAASRAEVKREQEQAADQVRIMTVHGSKGLQAPVVIMPDTMGAPKRSAAVLWPDEVDGRPSPDGEPPRSVPLYAPRRAMECGAALDARAVADRRRDQEYRRLLYVALTRAEDRLFVAGYEGRRRRPEGCWYDLVRAGLEALPESMTIELTGAGFADWPSRSALRHVTPQTVPPRDEMIGGSMTAETAALPAWCRVNAPEEGVVSRPLTPSRPDTDEPGLNSPLGDDGGARFRRGLIIHRLLQTLPEIAPERRAAAGRAFLDGCHSDLTESLRREWLDETLAVMELPATRHLFAPGSRAEVSVVGTVVAKSGAERVLSGQIDRLVVTDGEVWIADYKTNRPAPTTPETVPTVYINQLAAYRAALAKVYPGRAIRCALVWTDGPRLMEIPDTLLDRAGFSI